MRGMLVNESVYMSVNHFVLPFQYQGKEAVSEFWIDPDAEKKEDRETSREKRRRKRWGQENTPSGGL